MAKHRVLIVGVGSIGERHARCFSNTGRAEVLICEPMDERRAAVIERVGAAQGYADLEQAIAAAPELAVICAPAHLHVAMALKLIEAGVHVLIEKPLSTTLDDTPPLERAIAQHGVKAAVAYVMRMHPALAAMKQALDEGRFGRPVQAVIVGGQHFPTFRPAYREIYYRSRATGGGAVQDALTHLINATEWLIGPMTRLAADTHRLLLDGVDVEDTVHVLARHGDVAASYSLNQHQAPNETTVTILCERGAARLELHENRWRWMAETCGAWSDEPAAPLERDDLFTAQANRFLDYVEGAADEPHCTIAEAKQTLRACLAILAAADTQTWRDVS